jgi:D-alanine-D-alanine ligase
MRIAVLYNLDSTRLPGGLNAPDRAYELDHPRNVQAYVSALEQNGHIVMALEGGLDMIERLLAFQPDLCFNTCEGYQGDSRESQVPAILEALGMRYTAAAVLGTAVTLDKSMTKRVLRGSGLPTPAWQTFRAADEPLDASLHFPLFVKPAREGTGIGITPNSLVHDEVALRQQLANMIEMYHQPVLVERYVPGRDITAGLVGDLHKGIADVYFFPLAEVDYSGYPPGTEQFYSARLKVDWADLYRGKCPAPLSPAQADEIRRLAWEAARVTECYDVARVDFRLDAQDQERPYILEVNGLPGMTLVSDLTLMAQAVGQSHADLINAVVNAAARRYGLQI